MGVVTNWGEAILSALGNALNVLLTFIPRFLGFLVILLVGWLVADLVSKAITVLLRKIGFDRMSQRIGLTRLEQRMGLSLDSAAILGRVVYWFLFLIFLVPAADTLGIPAVSNILNQLVDYIPNVFVAILVLFLGSLAATVAADLVRGATGGTGIGNPNVFAAITRWAIISFAALIALEQLNIAPNLLNILFTAVIGALAIAFGLAFGLGGQDAARRWLNRGEVAFESAAPRIQQQMANRQNDTASQAANGANTYSTPQVVPTAGYQQAPTSYPTPATPPTSTSSDETIILPPRSE
ncbi:MAG TPA: hypothetical protein VGD98_16140 [Ktedonobacteraceae bacterium]